MLVCVQTVAKFYKSIQRAIYFLKQFIDIDLRI